MARKGLSRAKASALAVMTPTMTPPISPGPPVAAIASSSARPSPAVRQRFLDQPVQALEMGARGDFRHDAAEAPVLGQLAVDDVGQDRAERSGTVRRLDDGDRRLVAARFDSQHAHLCLLASAVHLR